ncbi:formyltransferase family protein [Desulfovibrio sp. JC010]|uniref:formyltransferase family protein n=1 Tax=Desulfovibrio sp. JC010 TaxID=2593641 RepID=UPI0013D28260|nr:formyltransferase family protein [Desulfovibrio sp. JC010]NDV27487.1 hypothetical protein [Desulfovibrio sp. JC010]
MSGYEHTYTQAGLTVIPRILAHMDRNALSRTQGVFKRDFWAWKVAPFPDASMQYALRLFAQAYIFDVDGNRFFQSSRLLSYIEQGLSAWADMQHRDGSFDQVFPHDHSFGATAYTVSGVLDVLDMVGEYLPGQAVKRVEAALSRAGEFLLKNEEGYASIANHMALFALAFDQLYRHTSDERYRQRAREFVRELLKIFSPEGWFAEYEGADPGYQTQCLHYLARLAHRGYSELEPAMLEAVTGFMPYFVHPDGSLGGHYGARLTCVVYPGGVSRLAASHQEASAMLDLLAKGVENGTTPIPEWLDLPNAARLASNYLDAARYLRERPAMDVAGYTLPCLRGSVWKEFSKAGLLIAGTPSYYAVVSTGGGGNIVAFDKATGKRAYEDRGYCALIQEKEHCTQAPGCSSGRVKENSVTITAPFSRLAMQRMTPVRHLCLLMAGLTLFRFKWLRESAKKLLVKLLVRPGPQSSAHMLREISFSENKIIFRDSFTGPAGMQTVRRVGEGTSIHMASADFFDFSQLAAKFDSAVPAPGFSAETVWNFPAAEKDPQAAECGKKVVVLCDNSTPSVAAVNHLAERLSGCNLLIVEERPLTPSRMVRTLARTVKRRGVLKTLDIVALQLVLPLYNSLCGRHEARKFTPDFSTTDVNRPEVLARVSGFSPDLIVTCRCAILTRETLAALGCPIINAHPGITPRFRGVGNLFALAEKRFDCLGATVHRVDAGIDTGEVLVRKVVDPAVCGVPFVAQEIFIMRMAAEMVAGYILCDEPEDVDEAPDCESRIYLRAGLNDWLAARRGYRELVKQSASAKNIMEKL